MMSGEGERGTKPVQPCEICGREDLHYHAASNPDLVFAAEEWDQISKKAFVQGEPHHHMGIDCKAWAECSLQSDEQRAMGAVPMDICDAATCQDPGHNHRAVWPEDRKPLHQITSREQASEEAFHAAYGEPTKEVSRWADSAMFRSEPMPTGDNGRVTPKAYLLNATPDPLGSLAALNAIYTGEVVRSLSQVTDPERRTALEEVRKNKLQGPLEVIQFHFLLEGVSRAFTHQIVRGRHAFYAQESLRFAVVEGESWIDRCAYPPSLTEKTPENVLQRDDWEDSIINAQNAYSRLVGDGIPAEDARGLMPHAMTTRIHWVCSLRELLYVAGVRLCTQAQFEWRSAMASVVQALRDRSTYAPNAAGRATYLRPRFDGMQGPGFDGWQFQEIANLLRPICYQEGACGFKAKADRSCSIRERVDFREQHSTNRKDSSNWHKPMIADVVKYSEPGSRHEAEFGRAYIETVTSPGIDPAEWLADPNAAR